MSDDLFDRLFNQKAGEPWAERAEAHVPLNLETMIAAATEIKREHFVYVIASEVIPADAYGILILRPKDAAAWKPQGGAHE